MNKNDQGMGELLKVLKAHPDLINALLFNPKSIRRLLKSRAARQLVIGVDTEAFLRSVAGSREGGPIALCRRQTAVVIAQAGCPRTTVPTIPPTVPPKCPPPQPRLRMPKKR